jgi:hypothetical protein
VRVGRGRLSGRGGGELECGQESDRAGGSEGSKVESLKDRIRVQGITPRVRWFQQAQAQVQAQASADGEGEGRIEEAIAGERLAHAEEMDLDGMVERLKTAMSKSSQKRQEEEGGRGDGRGPTKAFIKSPEWALTARVEVVRRQLQQTARSTEHITRMVEDRFRSCHVDEYEALISARALLADKFGDAAFAYAAFGPSAVEEWRLSPSCFYRSMLEWGIPETMVVRVMRALSPFCESGYLSIYVFATTFFFWQPEHRAPTQQQQTLGAAEEERTEVCAMPAASSPASITTPTTPPTAPIPDDAALQEASDSQSKQRAGDSKSSAQRRVHGLAQEVPGLQVASEQQKRGRDDDRLHHERMHQDFQAAERFLSHARSSHPPPHPPPAPPLRPLNFSLLDPTRSTTAKEHQKSQTERVLQVYGASPRTRMLRLETSQQWTHWKQSPGMQTQTRARGTLNQGGTVHSTARASRERAAPNEWQTRRGVQKEDKTCAREDVGESETRGDMVPNMQARDGIGGANATAANGEGPTTTDLSAEDTDRYHTDASVLTDGEKVGAGVDTDTEC